MSSASTKKPSPLVRVAGIATVVASIAVVLTVGSEPVTTEFVDASLKRFSDYVTAETALSGKQGSVTWGAVTLEGFAWTRHARVADVKLEVKKQSLLESVSWSVTTPEMIVEPDHMMAHRIYYSFRQPINVSRNGTPSATISFPEPLKYGQIEMPRTEGRLLVQNFKLPSRIDIVAAASPEEKVVISYAPDPLVEVTSGMDKPSRHAQYRFKNLAITAGEEKPISIAALDSELTESTDDNGKISGHYLLAMDDVLPEGIAKPCDISADMSYQGAEPVMKILGMAAVTEPTSLSLQSLALDCTEYKMAVTGTVARSAEDPLPSGAVTVHLEQVANLLKSDLLAAQGKELLAQILNKVTGQPVDTLTNVDLPIKREPNGTLYVGSVTFEELAASVFANMLGTGGVPLPPTSQAPQPEPLPQTATPPASPMLDSLPQDPAQEEPMDDTPAAPGLD